MNNNDILRRLRYTLEFGDSKMIAVCKLGKLDVNREQLSAWLKKEDDTEHVECSDSELAAFLDGLIIDKRGRKDGPQVKTETQLTNNSIFMKLKIAFDLQADAVLAILEKAEFSISKHELSAFFRKPGNRHYRNCQDQILRKFLKGLQLTYRNSDIETDSSSKESTSPYKNYK